MNTNNNNSRSKKKNARRRRQNKKSIKVPNTKTRIQQASERPVKKLELLPAKYSNFNRGVSNKKLNNFYDPLVFGYIMLRPIPFPRPVPFPVSTYSYQNKFSYAAPNVQTMQVVFELLPDTLSCGIVRDFSKPDYVLAVNVLQSSIYEFGTFKTRGNVVFITPAFQKHDGSELAALIFQKTSVYRAAKANYISLQLDYRINENLNYSYGALPYYNVELVDVADAYEIKFNLQCWGYFDQAAHVELIEYTDLDLKGTESIHNFASVDTDDNQKIYVNVAHKLQSLTRSFCIAIVGMTDIHKVLITRIAAYDPDHALPIIVRANPTVISTVPEKEFSLYQSALDRAGGYSITGLAGTLTCNSPEQFSGGLTYSALVPFSQSVPSFFDEAYNVVTQQQFYKYQGRAVEGAHGYWFPDSLDQLEVHQKLYVYRTHRLIMGINFTASGAASPSLEATFTQRIELQHNLVTLPSVVPPLHPYFIPSYFGALREEQALIFGCNPTHFQRLKKAAVKIAKNPAVKRAAKEIGTQVLTGLVKSVGSAAMML